MTTEHLRFLKKIRRRRRMVVFLRILILFLFIYCFNEFDFTERLFFVLDLPVLCPDAFFLFFDTFLLFFL